MPQFALSILNYLRHPWSAAAVGGAVGRVSLRSQHSFAQLREYLEVIVVIAAVTAVGWVTPVTYRAFGHVYLLTVIMLCLRVGRGPGLFAAIVSGVTWNFFIMPPRLSFSTLDLEDDLMLGTYFIVALIAGQLTARIRADARLEESERLHRTLLDSVSHELRTPLAVLRSAAEKLGTAEPARRAHVAAEIHTATRRLDHLVGNLLNQTRLEAGALRAQLDWCDARDLINAARRATGDAFAGRAVNVEIPRALPLFRVDALLLEQALVNLLLNAALHTPSGSPVTVSAGVDHSEPHRVFIAVADRGPGIPPEMRACPFAKFRRGKDARAGGVGLGLSIVHGFVAAHGGSVVVDENPGGGARFTLYLPGAAHDEVPEA